MKLFFILTLFSCSLFLKAQTPDTTKVNVQYQPNPSGSGANKPDDVYILLNGDMLSVTIVDYFAGSTNGPVWAIWHLDKDTIDVKIKDASTVFHLDMEISNSTFKIPVKSNQNSVFVKLNNKLYKVDNIITRIENPEKTIGYSSYSYGKMLLLSGTDSEAENLMIFNSEGKLVMNMDCPPENLSLESLDKGIYVATLTKGKAIIRKKLFLE